MFAVIVTEITRSRRGLPQGLAAGLMLCLAEGLAAELNDPPLHQISVVIFAFQIGSDWPQMGHICDFLRSVSVHFGSAN